MALMRSTVVAPKTATTAAPVAAPQPVLDVDTILANAAAEVEEAPAVNDPAPAVNAPAIRQTQAVSTDVRAPAVDPGKLLAEMGFEGLDIDGDLVFPVIKMDSGRLTDSDGNDYGKSVVVRCLKTRKKFVWRALLNGKVIDSKKDVAYSYDNATTSRGRALQDVVNEWAAEGKEVEQKEYLEIDAQIHAPGADNDQDFVQISISPTSVKRFKRWAIPAAMKCGGQLDTLLLEVGVGPQIKDGGNSYYPFAFQTFNG